MAWFKDWFGTPYYKMLYRHRSDEEAHAFLDALISHIGLVENCKVLDLGCGRGRHSIYLASKGLDVTGVDITPESIAEANKFSNNHLHFIVGDMRQSLPGKDYSAIINVFTSFGYFETEAEDIATLQNVSDALKDNGIFIMDFFNAQKVINGIQAKGQFQCDKVHFDIRKKIENKFIIKEIHVTDEGKEFTYAEKVKLLTKADFERYFSLVGLELSEVFGDYDLSPFNETNSERLILITKKRNLQS